MKKYLSIQVKPNRKPIRTYRLGDGYFLEHLAYRIEHKNFEMPLSEIAKYDGIQREYAICLRQIQIMLYKAPEPDRPHYVSYRTVLKNYELLCYLHNNNIHSVGELKDVVSKAEGKYSQLKYNAAKEDPYRLKKKSVRGGSWKDPESHIRSAWRSFEYQNQPRSYIGFRCVRSLANTTSQKSKKSKK